MAFIDRIRELNNGGSIDRVPFLIGGLQRGWVAPDMAARLARARDVFTYENSTIALAEPLLVATFVGIGVFFFRLGFASGCSHETRELKRSSSAKPTRKKYN